MINGNVNNKKEISDYDKEIYHKIRENIKKFLKEESQLLDSSSSHVLDIAPQIHEGVKKFFIKSKISTLDIDPSSKSTYIADICKNNRSVIEDSSFDIVVCTEVLEHTLDPFSASAEIYRILKSGGKLLLSTPFDFRIHGPLPDCWRFTEHGLRAILNRYSSVDITPLENENRFLMPYHYTTIATK
jgi:SAM-dependent methyltransferase